MKAQSSCFQTNVSKINKVKTLCGAIYWKEQNVSNLRKGHGGINTLMSFSPTVHTTIATFLSR